jgi:hypothetical protein
MSRVCKGTDERKGQNSERKGCMGVIELQNDEWECVVGTSQEDEVIDAIDGAIKVVTGCACKEMAVVECEVERGLGDE